MRPQGQRRWTHRPSRRLNIERLERRDLLASVSILPSEVVADVGEQIAFQGSVQGSSGQQLNYEWDFGDGSTTNGTLTPQHTYTNAGGYTATLTVDNANNLGLPNLPSGTVGFWDFEGSAADGSGSGHDGTVYGAGYVPGLNGEALSFDGTDDYVDVGNSPTLDNMDTLTYSAWIYPTASGDRVVISKLREVRELRLKGSDSNMQLRGCILTTPGYTCSESVQGAISLNQWQYVAMTYDHQGDKKVHLYIDGAEASYASQAVGSGVVWDDAAKDMSIGRRSHGAHYFAGMIDDVFVINRALDPAEIQSNYDNSTGTPPAAPAIPPPAVWIARTEASVVVNSPSPTGLKAFPSATGYAANVTGGRGGDVFTVTTLADYGNGQTAIPGSLRYGIENASGPRTIVFAVGGNIQLEQNLTIDSKVDMTIAGQTAPGDGITISGYPTRISNSNNMIIRYLRFRTGDFNAEAANGKPSKGNGDMGGGGGDAFEIVYSDGVIIDHVSTSWGIDETLTGYHVTNITIQNSIIAESLNDSYHPQGPHGLGSLFRSDMTQQDRANGTGGITYYGNLVAKHKKRLPGLASGNGAGHPIQLMDAEVVNNVMYDWIEEPAHVVGNSSFVHDLQLNLIGNYFIAGPDTPNNVADQVFSEYAGTGSLIFGVDTNYTDGNKDGIHDGVPADVNSVFLLETPLQTTAFDLPLEQTAAGYLTAPDAYDYVLANAGASLVRDAHDSRIVNEVANRTGQVIDSQDELVALFGMQPLLTMDPGIPLVDSDGDGMPDSWEIANGLNANDANDRNGTNLSGIGYTNLEVYLSSVVGESAVQNSAPVIDSFSSDAIDTDPGNVLATNIPTTSNVEQGTSELIIPIQSGALIDAGTVDAVRGLGNLVGPHIGASRDAGAHELGAGVAWTGNRQFVDFLAFGVPDGWTVAAESDLASYTDLGATSLQDGRLVLVHSDPNQRAFIAVDFEAESNEAARWARYDEILSGDGIGTPDVGPVYFRDGLGASIVDQGTIATFLGARVDLEGVIKVTGGTASSDLYDPAQDEHTVQDGMFTLLRSLYHAYTLPTEGSSATMALALPPVAGFNEVTVSDLLGGTAGTLRADVTMSEINLMLDIVGSPDLGDSTSVQFRRVGSFDVWHDALDLQYTNSVDKRGVPFERQLGNIFRLSPGTEYEVKVTINHPSNPAASVSQTTTFTTRAEPRVIGGVTREVFPGDNLDATMSLVGPGDTILFHGGTYTGDYDFDGNGSNETWATDNYGGSGENPVLLRPYGDGDVNIGGLIFGNNNRASENIWLDGFKIGTSGIRSYEDNEVGWGRNITLTRNTVTNAFHTVQADTGWIVSDNVLIGHNPPPGSYSGEGVEFNEAAIGGVVAFNDISLVGDGVSYGDRLLVVMGNLVHDFVDDCVEMDYSSGGYTAMNNVCHGGVQGNNHGFSYQPIQGGTTYVVGNQASGFRAGGFKVRSPLVGTIGNFRFVVGNTVVAYTQNQHFTVLLQPGSILANNFLTAMQLPGSSAGDHFGYGSLPPGYQGVLLWDYNHYNTPNENKVLSITGMGDVSVTDLQNDLNVAHNSRYITEGAPGLQVDLSTTNSITFSAQAHDDNPGDTISWSWAYKKLGVETLLQSGTGSILDLDFSLVPHSVGDSLEIILRVSDGSLTTNWIELVELL